MDDPHLGHSVPESFDRLQTDIERVEYILNCHSFIRDFELRSKYGIKSFEKTVQFRDDGKDHSHRVEHFLGHVQGDHGGQRLGFVDYYLWSA